MNTGAHPDHFFAAIEHGLATMRAGLAVSVLGVLARTCAERGLVDAADGYDHVRLLMTKMGDDTLI